LLASFAVIGRPDSSEHAPHFDGYISLVAGADILAAFDSETDATRAFLHTIAPEKSLYRYAPGKWSIRESVLHVVDCERVFVYRALRFGRGERTAVEGFEPDDWVAPSGADGRPWPSILAEYDDVRRATIGLFRHLPEDAWPRAAPAGGNRISVRALAYVVVGHDMHHRNVIRERYL
jgi:uncharacterized damage-inducible protein DinB